MRPADLEQIMEKRNYTDQPPRDPVEYDNFLASAEVLAFAAFLESVRLPEIAEIIRKIGRQYGYRQTAEWFRPAFLAYRNRR